MHCQQNPDALSNLLSINTATRPKKPDLAKPAREKEKKHPFTSTITAENKQRLARYQANKPGGALTTDVFNQALERFLDAHRQYADVAPRKRK